MPATDVKFVEAYRASHPVQAHAIKFALEEAGIRVVIENEALQDGIGDIPCGWSSSPRLLVDESQFAAAREIIRQTDHSTQSEPGLTQSESTHCLACNAIMADSEVTCPRCGWTYNSDESVEPL